LIYGFDAIQGENGRYGLTNHILERSHGFVSRNGDIEIHITRGDLGGGDTHKYRGSLKSSMFKYLYRSHEEQKV
jgi:hypothetical protein